MISKTLLPGCKEGWQSRHGQPAEIVYMLNTFRITCSVSLRYTRHHQMGIIPLMSRGQTRLTGIFCHAWLPHFLCGCAAFNACNWASLSGMRLLAAFVECVGLEPTRSTRPMQHPNTPLTLHSGSGEIKILSLQSCLPVSAWWTA